MNSSENRCRQLRRVLIIVERIAVLKYGATIGDLARAVRDFTGESACERTVRRDLNALNEIGIAEKTEKGRWRLQNSTRGAAFAAIAEAIAAQALTAS